MATHFLVVKRRKNTALIMHCINTPLQNIIVFKAVKMKKKSLIKTVMFFFYPYILSILRRCLHDGFIMKCSQRLGWWTAFMYPVI